MMAWSMEMTPTAARLIPKAETALEDCTMNVSTAASGTDAASFSIDASTGQLKTSAALDFETKSSYSVTVGISDSKDSAGNADTVVDDTIDVTITVTNEEEAGTVALSSDRPAVDTELTATLSDPDGTPSAVTWQWSSSATTTGTFGNISGATSASYTPAAGDVGEYLRATASYTDPEASGKTASATTGNRVVDPAVEETVCDAPNLHGRRQVWSAQLTVGEVSESGSVVRYGVTQSQGHLSERNFRSGSNRYRIRQITQSAIGTKALEFQLGSPLTEYDRTKLKLHVCEQEFEFAIGKASIHVGGANASYSWVSSGLDWSATPMRRLVLSAHGRPMLEDRLNSGDCRDLSSRGPSCGIGSSIDERPEGYSDRGEIQSASDKDVWSVILQRGQSYVIEVKGAGDPGGDNAGTLADPGVEIHELDWTEQTGWTWTERASNDNVSATNKNARVMYTYPSGSERQTPIGIRVLGKSASTGTYTVLIRAANDCTSDTTTTCTIAVGSSVQQRISSPGDQDAWAVMVEGGKTYQIDLKGQDSGDGSLKDSHIYLRNPSETIVDDDDGGVGHDSQITYMVSAGQGGRYIILVTAGVNRTGSYTLTVTDITPMMQEEDPTPLTVQFAATPLEHDGTTPFAVDVRFSEAIVTSAEQMRASVEVTGGNATGAARRDVANQEIWRITVTPSGEGDIIVRVPVTSDCSSTAAICASAGRGVSQTISTTVFRAGLLGHFVDMPREHDGSSAFTFELHFTEAPKLSYRTVRDQLFTVGGGNVTRARRVTKGSNLAFEVTVEPDGFDDVSLTVAPTSDCAASAGVCTHDGRPMHNTLQATVPGPAALSVADTSVREAPGATLDFVVTLSRARHEATTVQYATSDGTATVGDDYTNTNGTLTFETGETHKTIPVPVVDDGVDDDGETVILTLSNASTPTRITDATAIGTIENADPMPRAWLVRFGRTVGTQVVDALSDRFDGSRRSHVTVGGIEIRNGTIAEYEANAKRHSTPRAGWDLEAQDEEPERMMTLEDLAMGTRFHLSSGAPDGGGTAFTAWGRVARSGFEAEVDDVTMDGDVTSALFGFDAEWKRALAGVMLSQSSGDGSYRLNPALGGDAGTVKSNLTGVYPYARLTLNPKLSGWALAGMGSGELTLRQNGKEDMATDIEMRMGALGVSADIVAAADTGGLALRLKSDAMWVSTRSDATEGFRSSEGDVRRLRLTLHGERPFTLSGERTLTPSAEVGLRHDAGDAETGAGLELGAGLRYSAGALTIQEGRVRTLITHADSDYKEWGASGSIQIVPDSSGRGLTVRIAPAWGATGSATDWLWGARDAGELGAGGTQFEGEGRIESEVGYGIALTRNRGLVAPYTALSLGDGGSRTWRLGARWKVKDDFTMRLEGTRGEGAKSEATNTVQLRAQLRW